MTRSIQRLKDKLQQQWETCQRGMRHSESNEQDRGLLLDWLQRHDRNSHHTLWLEILRGEHSGLRETLLGSDQIPEGDSFWRQMVTSSPFGLLDLRVKR